jgi:hypothetical protein
VRGVHDASQNIKCLGRVLKDLKVALSALDDLVSESSDALVEHASGLVETLSLDEIHECRGLLSDLAWIWRSGCLERPCTSRQGLALAIFRGKH